MTTITYPPPPSSAAPSTTAGSPPSEVLGHFAAGYGQGERAERARIAAMAMAWTQEAGDGEVAMTLVAFAVALGG